MSFLLGTRSVASVLCVLGFLSARSASPQAAWTELAGASPAQVRVIWTDDPATRATVSWSTAVATEVNRVHLSSSAHDSPAEYELAFDSHRDGAYSGSEKDGGVYFHHARVTGLTPGTDYSLVLESDGERSRVFRFRSAPDDERAFTLIYGGDARTGYEDRQRMNRMIAAYVAREQRLLAFVHGGDYVMFGDRWRLWRLWLSHHELCTTDDGRLLPIVPARGNHDYGVLYDEVFDAPWGGGKDYGSTQLAPDLALVTLNTNVSTAGDQADWIRQVLPRLRAANRWLLVQYHQPMWPALKAPSPAKDLWVSLFERSDVDLVMESDGHVVKRTVPIRAGKQDPTGVVYIGEGGLGAPLRKPRRGLWYLEAPGFVGSGLHITLLEVSPQSLMIRALGPTPEGTPPDSAGEPAFAPRLIDEWRLSPRAIGDR